MFFHNEVHKRDGRESSSITLPEPDAVDAPFPTNQFFSTSDADAHVVGSSLVLQNDVKESPLSNLPEAGDDGAPG